MKNDLVVFNANDPQLAQVEFLVKSLKDPDRGAFDGTACLITTGISSSVRVFLEKQGVEVFERTIHEVLDWEYASVLGAFEKYHMGQNPLWRRIAGKIAKAWPGVINVASHMFCGSVKRLAASNMRTSKGAEALRASFDLYHRKHFSKLNILPYLDENNGRFQRVLLLDSDIIFQRPVEMLFSQIKPGRVYVADELEPIIRDLPIARSNRLAKRFQIHRHLAYGEDAHEVNVGVVLADVTTFRHFMNLWTRLMFESGLEDLFIGDPQDFWHEQDFFRLLRDMHPHDFKSLDRNLICHAVHRAADDIEDRDGLFRLKVDGEIPVLVHFAGGSWKRFTRIDQQYRTSPNKIVRTAC